MILKSLLIHSFSYKLCDFTILFFFSYDARLLQKHDQIVATKNSFLAQGSFNTYEQYVIK